MKTAEHQYLFFPANFPQAFRFVDIGHAKKFHTLFLQCARNGSHTMAIGIGLDNSQDAGF